MQNQATVAIIHDEDTKRAVHKALELIGGIHRTVPPKLEGPPTFLIKPNACKAADPNSGEVTNFRVVEAIIEEVRSIGGIPLVGESCIGSSPEKTDRALRSTGIWDAAERLGAKIVNFDMDEEVLVSIPKGRVLKRIGMAMSALQCDVRVSVPVLKYHPNTRVTLGLKNMKGCLLGQNKKRTHDVDLHQAIADYNTILRPHLVIIDGTVAGAWSPLQKPVKLNAIIAGFDPVATDSVGSLILGVDPNTVEHLHHAMEHGLGVFDINKIEVKGTPIKQISILKRE